MRTESATNEVVKFEQETGMNFLFEDIEACVDRVRQELGAGLPEEFYLRALLVELDDQEVPFKKHKEVAIEYRGGVVGILPLAVQVASEVALEVLTVEELLPAHTNRILALMKATGCKLGLLVNFGNEQVHVQRIVGRGAEASGCI